MTNKFENMSVNEIAKYINNIEAGPSHIDAAFEALKSLDAGTRKSVVDALENLVIDDIRDVVEDCEMTLGPLTKSTEQYLLSISGGPEEVAMGQSACQIFLHISQIKGNEAHPVTKASVKALSALSDAQYNNAMKLTVVFMKACKKADAAEISKSAPKTPNPFKPGKPNKPRAPQQPFKGCWK